jgi:hypothetical protein
VNRLYFGDNLEWLRDRREFPDASVDLVYLDPPFHTFLKTSPMMAYLAMMAPRLVELHRILKRRLFKRQRDAGLMRKDFIQLHYPCYWHYDILFGLKVMAEAGWLSDERCREALEVLEARQMADSQPKGNTIRARQGRSVAVR